MPHVDDIAQLTAFAHRLGALIGQLRRLADIPSDGEAPALERAIAECERRLGAFAEFQQHRLQVTWSSREHKPRHEPNRWIARRPLESSDFEDEQVSRFNMQGRPAAEDQNTPPLSGEWRQNQTGKGEPWD